MCSRKGDWCELRQSEPPPKQTREMSARRRADWDTRKKEHKPTDKTETEGSIGGGE